MTSHRYVREKSWCQVIGGQNSSGNQHGIPSNCKDDRTDNIIITRTCLSAKATSWKTCSTSGDSVFKGSDLAGCSFMSPWRRARRTGRSSCSSIGGPDSQPCFSSDLQGGVRGSDVVFVLGQLGYNTPQLIGSAALDRIGLDINMPQA
ncbi:hypothetical protein V8E53_007629 [Lactarius tabidus]